MLWPHAGLAAQTMGEQPPPAALAVASATPSAWSPFRHRLFAAMWGAQFVSNTGSWMQTVAAQWLMLTLTSSATYVALVQTAAGLPVVLFAVLAGTVGDLVDRRRFLLITQAFMLIAATALGALAIAGLVTPWVLLALIFAVGTGQALTSPTWQTLQPELVSPAERPQAISLGSVNQNLARAVGPAIGGVTPGGDQCRHRLPGQRRHVRRRHRGDRGLAFAPARRTRSRVSTSARRCGPAAGTSPPAPCCA